MFYDCFAQRDGVDGRLVSLERFFDTLGKTTIEEYKSKIELDLAAAIEPYRKADIYKSEGSTSSSSEEREFFDSSDESFPHPRCCLRKM